MKTLRFKIKVTVQSLSGTKGKTVVTAFDVKEQSPDPGKELLAVNGCGDVRRGDRTWGGVIFLQVCAHCYVVHVPGNESYPHSFKQL